jgi:hypothetical protein
MARSKREKIPVRHLLMTDQAMTTPPAMFWNGDVLEWRDLERVAEAADCAVHARTGR